MEKVSMKSKILYRLRAVIAAICGKEISFVFSQVEKWFKGELVSQEISNAVYGSDVFMELSQEYDRKLAEKDGEIKNLQSEIRQLGLEDKGAKTFKGIAEQICEALPVGCYIITIIPPMTSSTDDVLEMIRKYVPVGTCLSICRWDKTYSIEFT